MISIPRKPAILFVALSLERGGTERHLAEIMPRLVAKGWPVSLYCLATRGDMADDVARQNVRIIAPPAGGGAHLGGATGLVRKVLSATKLASVMAFQRPQIVHFFLPGPYLIGGPIAVATGRPVRIMSRRNLNHYMAKRPLAKRLEIALHGRMSAILGNSRAIIAQLLDEEGCDRQRVGLIYNGVDLTAIDSARDRSAVRSDLGLTGAKFVAGIVANLISYKGHSDLLQALALVKDLLPQPWAVLCIGRDEGCLADLEKLSRNLGVDGNVRFLGSRADIADLLAGCDAGILCSHEEGFSNAVIEGMAAGLPMIVTRVGGNPEAVRDGIDGLVVPPKDPVALSQAILAIALAPPNGKAMGAAAAKRVRNNFTIAACVDRYDQLYRGLLAGETANSLAPPDYPQASPGP